MKLSGDKTGSYNDNSDFFANSDIKLARNEDIKKNSNKEITILCIDDEYLVRKSIVLFLNRSGFNVLEADNGRKGLEMFDKYSPAAVLADIKMPELSGLELLAILRKKAPDIPVIIISGAGIMNSAEEAIRLGAWDFITKPIYDPAIVEHTIKRELERAHMIRELRLFQRNLEDEIIRRTNEVYRELKERKVAEKALKKSYEDLEKIMSGTLFAFGRLSEARDPYTAGHQKRVSKLACEVGRELGLSEDKCKGIEVAGSLHDIGKINIPSEILNKPGKLTEIEMNLIKTHPQIGYEIVKNIPFPWPVSETIIQHHERLDGSGYPYGIKGDEICLYARIIGVVDVVEAMSSHRPYRPALGMDAALSEITQNQKTKYDNEVVNICIKLIRENGFNFNE
jgi:putative nucleotidyltransferase with HDIG domain